MKRRIIFSEDGGALAGGHTHGLYGGGSGGAEAYLRELFGPLVGTHVDTFVWSIGNTHQLSYDTKVAERFHEYGVESTGQIEAAWCWRWWRNLKDLIETGFDPPRIILDAAHDLGMETFASLRMNDSHDAFMPSLDSRLKTEHPEWLIGEPGRDYGERTRPNGPDGLSGAMSGLEGALAPRPPRVQVPFPEWLASKPRNLVEWWRRRALNYAVPEVRAYILSIVDEITEYGFDGVELDFMTFPYIFRLGQEQQHMDLLTGMVRDIRELIDRKAQDKPKPGLLMTRVPARIDRCREIGIDVETWIKDGLIDMLSIGRSYIPFSIPTEEWVRAVEGTSCKIYPSYNMMIGGVRQEYKTIEALRAFSMLHHSAGADGIYLFNYGHPDPAVLGEIGQPDIIEERDKLYVADPPIVIDTVMFSSIPDELIPLPVELNAEGDSKALGFRIGDKLERNEAREITLRMEISNLTEEDELEFTLNGVNLVVGRHTPSFNHWTLEYPLASPPLRSGENQLEVHLKKRNPLIEPSLEIGVLHVSIKYNR